MFKLSVLCNAEFALTLFNYKEKLSISHRASETNLWRNRIDICSHPDVALGTRYAIVHCTWTGDRKWRKYGGFKYTITFRIHKNFVNYNLVKGPT